MDPTWQAEYRARLPAAQAFARKLPLVRVAVPDASGTPGHAERELREATQIEDIFRLGRLKPGHESANAHAIAGKLGVGPSLYVHGGRTHPDYGGLALVFSGLPGDESADVTPFGLGGLLCPASGPLHDQGKCTSPVAHDDEAEQRAFVAASRWISGWREPAGRFLAMYFGTALDRYFLPGADGKPERADPAGIHADPHTRDWRSWTFEVRLTGEIDLFDVLARGGLQAWAIDKELERRLDRETATTGASYPWWNELRRTSRLRVQANASGAAELFAQVDGEVRDRCLP
jgi:hypothetical protein